MSIVLEKNIQKDLKETAKQMGIDEKDLIERAVLLYLENAQKFFELKREFLAWDALSDEVFFMFSKKHHDGYEKRRYMDRGNPRS